MAAALLRAAAIAASDCPPVIVSAIIVIRRPLDSIGLVGLSGTYLHRFDCRD
jgi:hypothetical protein